MKTWNSFTVKYLDKKLRLIIDQIVRLTKLTSQEENHYHHFGQSYVTILKLE